MPRTMPSRQPCASCHAPFTPSWQQHAHACRGHHIYCAECKSYGLPSHHREGGERRVWTVGVAYREMPGSRPRWAAYSLHNKPELHVLCVHTVMATTFDAARMLALKACYAHRRSK